jgi:hypothetical protein
MAEALLALTYPPGTFDKIIDQMLDVQLKQRPEAKAIEPEMRAFFMEMRQQRIQEHLPELQQAIKAKMEAEKQALTYW